jgi:hypothetical protein
MLAAEYSGAFTAIPLPLLAPKASSSVIPAKAGIHLALQRSRGDQNQNGFRLSPE